MKNFIYVAVLALVMTACANASKNETKVATDYISDSVATAIVPAAATEVLPAAAPGPDAGGKVATEVVAAEAE